MGDPDGAAAELSKSVENLGAFGAQVHTNVFGRPLDDPVFEPLLAEADRLGGDAVMPIAAFRRFYTDTAMFGAPHAVRCAVEFFGPDHVLFGTDMPLGGPKVVSDTIADVESTGPEPHELDKIFVGNARRIFGLTG